MARRATRGLSGLSYKDLQREVRRRERRLRTLQRRYAALMRRDAALQAQIKTLGGRADGKASLYTPRVLPKNKVFLVDALRTLLQGKAMGVNEMCEAVQKAGYKTNAANFRVIVNQVVIKHGKMFKRVARGQYTSA